MKILIVGRGGSGKDTVAGIISRLSGLLYDPETSNTSKAIVALKPELKNFPKSKNRSLWVDAGNSLVKDNPSRLVDWCLGFGNDIVIGVRTITQLIAVRNKFDLLVWVDKKTLEFEGSFISDIDFSYSQCDFVINNNESLKKLEINLKLLCDLFSLDHNKYFEMDCGD